MGLPAVGVELASVEFSPLVFVAEDVERRADPFKPVFRFGVSGIAVRVVLLGEFAKRLADVIRAG
jgi:hypothetical protein